MHSLQVWEQISLVQQHLQLFWAAMHVANDEDSPISNLGGIERRMHGRRQGQPYKNMHPVFACRNHATQALGHCERFSSASNPCLHVCSHHWAL